MYISIIISLAVYGIDSFTAVSLLAFGKWTSSIDPNTIIDFSVQKIIFSACIIATFVNLGYEQIRAWRIMRRGSVAECYLDNLAVKMESTRMGSGQGWRRFLVFAELTKSKKGAEYVALFTYFSFQCRCFPRQERYCNTDTNQHGFASYSVPGHVNLSMPSHYMPCSNPSSSRQMAVQPIALS